MRATICRARPAWFAAAALAFCIQAPLEAQRRAGPPADGSARAAAPIDLTGYWVSVVTQNWRWRMVTPAKGDYLNIPMTVEAKRVADTWDPARDEAAGEQCKSYGAPALMSVPTRLHITWQDDNTLRVDTDAGEQTRLLRFGRFESPPGAARTWQGVSVAEWHMPRATTPILLRPAPRVAGEAPPSGPKGGSMKVTTTELRAGYLQKNGVPYSPDAVLLEYWDSFKRENGDEWIIITTQVEDPLYLMGPLLVSSQFRKEADGAGWDPTPCSTTW